MTHGHMGSSCILEVNLTSASLGLELTFPTVFLMFFISFSENSNSFKARKFPFQTYASFTCFNDCVKNNWVNHSKMEFLKAVDIRPPLPTNLTSGYHNCQPCSFLLYLTCQHLLKGLLTATIISIDILQL